MWQLLTQVQEGAGTQGHVDKLLDICDNISFKCFCPLGDAAVSPIASGIKHFRSDYDELIKKLTAGSVAG